MADGPKFSDFTGGEKLRIAVLTARMAKRGLAGDGVDLSDLKRKVERIENQALKRKKK
ncbi:DUF6257 family protein [Streptomyces scabiei]|uniref:DUF6257 family protein n=1 Tax=Streptomyces scabiei TaxID=1930 RepID=UPI0029AC23B2|nr:DUF6257 family protein [Streptomyces scabiei]MDX2538600.1 DUF6257 family protein [Streptomyces scabiei]MDX2799874.1 DUF6257 family protein [Streptomyces scabiei]MDX2858157.1 DUF6257 family protein [Streptomyces scabiei]MDX3277852.1 DUF6257 family protein [Streptomyces scabiei]MDX3828529.1 DUF6257 family protein [Streptomyces scabiei]